MRRIKQPGPVDPVRIESHAAALSQGKIDLPAGGLLMAAIADKVEGLGLRSAALDLSGISLAPLRFVMPAHSSTAEHVAFYSDTFALDGPIAIERGAATFGSRNGSPFLHGHVLWRDEAGRDRGGHILPSESVIAAPCRIGFKGSRDVEMATRFDPETNFTLFSPLARESNSENGEGGLIVAKIRPNEDLICAIEDLCRQHQVQEARIAGLIGSIVGARFEDGLAINSVPTEILGLGGGVRRQADGGYQVDLDLGLIDTNGTIHRGRPRRSENPVLICVELFLERC